MCHYRDEVYQLDAPFKGEGIPLLKTIGSLLRELIGEIIKLQLHMIIGGIQEIRKLMSLILQTIRITPTIIYDRNYQDRYSDPGSFCN